MAIHWQGLLHNGYPDVESMLKEMLAELKTEEKVAARLGISRFALHKKLLVVGLVPEPPEGSCYGRVQLSAVHG